MALISLVTLGAIGGIVYFGFTHHWFELSGSRMTSEVRKSAETAIVIFSGQPDVLHAAPGNVVEQDRSDPSVFWIRSSLKMEKSTGTTDGASLKVSSPLAQELAGKRIRVTISAKAGAGAAPFAVAYSTGGTANSGWIVFEPSQQFQDFSFVYRVPPSPGFGDAHYLGLWSDISGQGAPLAVRRVTITRLPGN